jgi:hypothetical protein
MRKCLCLIISLVSLAVPAAFAGVSVSAPNNGSTVQSPVHYVASSTSTCSKGVASMGIYTANNALAYTTQGGTLNTSLNLNPGTYHTVVEEWDYCGGATTTPITITVSNASASGVQVSSPANDSTMSGPVSFAATASSSCAQGVASMGIYTAPGQLAYVSNGSSLKTSLSLNSGTYNTVVQAWDYCGGAEKTPITVTVSGGSSGGQKAFSNLQRSGGWGQYGQRAPTFVDCSPSPCDNITFSMNQGVGSPSLSGNSSKYGLGQGAPYGDALFNNHLIGDFSSQGLPDTNKTLIPTLHNFVYDVYFYGSNVNASQALEFDINQFTNGRSFIWGHECRVAGGNEWDIWNNQAGHWVATGVPCHPKSNAWNHLVIQVERTSNNQLLYKSITLNDQTYNLNATYAPTPTSWYGVTVNYQMDGNSAQTQYDVYLDNLTFKYW